MNPARSFWVGGIAAVFLLLLLSTFMILGWPGTADSCVVKPDDKGKLVLRRFECYCEDYVLADVGVTMRGSTVLDAAVTGKPGIRQKSNSLSNLYALGTSFVVALMLYLDRRDKRHAGDNLMRGETWVPDLYVVIVLFLGLGSMFFHASLKQWGGNIDGLSMYLYAAFLPTYTMRRVIWPSALVFWLTYSGIAVVCFLLHIFLSPLWDGASMLLLGLIIAAYAGAEVWHQIRTGQVFGGWWLPRMLYGMAVGSFLVAVIFQTNSTKPGDAFCPIDGGPQSWFQPHGMLWHPLAGAMAVLLYFYWRAAKDPST